MLIRSSVMVPGSATRAGTRVLVEVLLLHRRLPAFAIEAAMAAAVRLDNPLADLVALEARTAASRPYPAPLTLITPHPARRRGDQPELFSVVPVDPRPLPTVDQYDTLLNHDTAAQGLPTIAPRRQR